MAKGKMPPQFAANAAKMKARSGGGVDKATHAKIAKHAAAAARHSDAASKHMDNIAKLAGKDCM